MKEGFECFRKKCRRSVHAGQIFSRHRTSRNFRASDDRRFDTSLGPMNARNSGKSRHCDYLKTYPEIAIRLKISKNPHPRLFTIADSWDKANKSEDRYELNLVSPLPRTGKQPGYRIYGPLWLSASAYKDFIVKRQTAQAGK